MAHYFFPSTRLAVAEMTALFDFVWPTAAALWNLRWQVNGFLKEVPNSTPAQLNERFVFGSNIHGTNLRRACEETSWDTQKHHLAGIILTNAFAVYEHWADDILSSLGMAADCGLRLQRDDDPKGRIGLPGTLRSICAKESATLKVAYYPIFSSVKKYSWPHIANLLACYRFFKEMRNSQMHSGGIASKRVADAYLAFAPVSTKSALGLKEELIHDPIIEGKRFALHIRGVVGFCDVLIRIMVTVDAELCRAQQAEVLLEKTFRDLKYPPTLSSNKNRRHAQVLKFCKSAHLPNPANTEAIYKFLISKRLATI